MSISMRLSRNPRIGRIPARLWRDIRLVGMLRNWPDALRAELVGTPPRILRLRNGVVLHGLPTLDLAFLFHEIYVRQVYTPPGYRIRAGDVVVDVGANIGVFATYAATRASGVAVHCYEPFAESVAWLRRNVADSGLSNVSIHEAAIAGSPGIRHLAVHPQWCGLNALSAEDAAPGSVPVNCLTLDEAFRRAGLDHCDLLKLDCEGSEYEILRECSGELLARVSRIVGEYHEGPGFAGTGRDLCHLLEAHAFRVDRFEPLEEGVGIFCATHRLRQTRS